MKRIAIIGGGAAGMGAAYELLKAGHEVTLFEVRDRLGGNCFSVEVPLRGGGTYRVDGGVTEFNRTASRCFATFLAELGVELRPVVRDTSFMTPSGEALWHGRGGKLKIRRRCASGLRWLGEIERFEQEAVEVLDGPGYVDWTVRRYLDERGYSADFRRLYLYPQSAACFSLPGREPGRFPIRGLVGFWRAHGLVDSDSAARVSVSRGMHGYCETFSRWFAGAGGRLLSSWRVVGVSRRGDLVRIRALHRDGGLSVFEADQIVLATLPDAAVDLLDDATVAERLVASSFDFRQTRVVVHGDRRLMPRPEKAWGAYNYLVEPPGQGGQRSTYSVYLNLLADLPAAVPHVFATINPHIEPNPQLVLADRTLIHPVSGRHTAETARLIDSIQGRRRTWFCGSYLREPFLHEQALMTGFDVAGQIVAAAREALRTRPVSLAALAVA